MQVGLRRRPGHRGPIGEVANLRSEAVTEPAAEKSPSVEGTTIGHYRLLGELGAGGMATVYRAVDLRTKQFVCVKRLHDNLTGVRFAEWRLLHEAHVLQKIQHPAIPGFIEVIEQAEPRVVAVVTELIPSISLHQHLTRGPMDAEDARFVIDQLIGALAAVHAAGVVHRDIKPENVLLTFSADRITRVALIDFGIAYSDAEQRAFADVTPMALGTPSYMAPEQVSADPVSSATDVYALGELLYEMLSGQRPFRGTAPDIMAAKLLDEGPALDAIEAQLRDVIERCMARQPDARPTLDEITDTLAPPPKRLANDWTRTLMKAVSSGVVAGAGLCALL